MACLCRSEACVNIVNVYIQDNLIHRGHLFFEIKHPPRIIINQRIFSVCEDNRRIRNIIKIINFEKIPFKNLCVINEIKPGYNDIWINFIDGLWCIDNNNLVITIPEIESLGVKTIDYCLCVDSDEICSIVYLLEDFKKVKSCYKNVNFN